MALSIVILAAGQGKRMHSQIPKVLHKLAGKTLLEHVIDTATQLVTTELPIVVFGHEGEQVRQALPNLKATWVEQKEQLGTGHALLQALSHIPKNDRVLVLYGDVPLISYETLKHFLTLPEAALGIITAIFPNPFGLGRIIRDENNKITHIIEEKDTNDRQRLIKEINTGIYLFPSDFLSKALPEIQNHNFQKEYYLTDAISFAVKQQIPIESIHPERNEEVIGINDRLQLSFLERFYQRRLAKKLMQQGVTLCDPERFDVRGDVTFGRDVTIDINVILEGKVVIGNNCTIGPHTILRDVILGDNVDIKAHCLIENAQIAHHCIIGPFARIRPGTVLSSHIHIGNFVEIKNSTIGDKSKINHLSYVGDTDIGNGVNIGAGTITCNYDGVNKHRTTIEDGVFIGSNSQLVAPVKIGHGATIGAGSTITKDAPAEQLTLTRTPQVTIKNWRKPKKKES